MEKIKEKIEDYYLRDLIQIYLNRAMTIELERSLEEEATLHLDDVSDLGVGRKLSLLRNGLRAAAHVIRKNPAFQNVETVSATSWIVTEKPKFLERLGFIIETGTPRAIKAIKTYKGKLKDSVVPEDKRNIEPSYSYISKDKFMELYDD